MESAQGGDESEDLLDKAVMRRQNLRACYQSPHYIPQLLNEDLPSVWLDATSTYMECDVSRQRCLLRPADSSELMHGQLKHKGHTHYNPSSLMYVWQETDGQAWSYLNKAYKSQGIAI